MSHWFVGKKHIFADEGHEQINFYARNDVGDCVRVGTDAKVEETVLNMHDNLKRKQGIQAMKGLEVHRSSVPFNESTVCVNQVYVTSRLNVHRLRVWDLSRPAGDNVLRDPSNGELTPTESLQVRPRKCSVYHSGSYSNFVVTRLFPVPIHWNRTRARIWHSFLSPKTVLC